MNIYLLYVKTLYKINMATNELIIDVVVPSNANDDDATTVKHNKIVNKLE
jgi:hypothetical protein